MMIKFYQFTPAHPVIPNYHDFYEISYFYSGKGIYHLADMDLPVRPGSIALVQAGQMHNAEADPGEAVKTVSLYFMPELIVHPGAFVFEYNYLLPFHHHKTRIPPVIQEKDIDRPVWNLILGMHHELNAARNFHQLVLKNRLCDLLVTLLKKLNIQEDTSLNHTAPITKIKRLEKVFNFIHAEYKNPIHVEHLAKIACMSKSYFCRYFKQVTGLTPVHYLLRYRIDKSKELLMHTDHTITEISFQTGFNSQSYFDRIFQRLTRLSPNQFRQSCSKTSVQ